MNTLAGVKTSIVLLATVLLFTGCASYTWYRSGAMQQDSGRDRYYCERHTPQAVWSPFMPLNQMVFAELQAKDEYERLFSVCMEDRGWTLRQVKSR